MNKPRIIVEVSGGVVQCVHADRPINVDVLDRDNMRECSRTGDEYKFYEKLEVETAGMESFQ